MLDESNLSLFISHDGECKKLCYRCDGNKGDVYIIYMSILQHLVSYCNFVNYNIYFFSGYFMNRDI